MRPYDRIYAAIDLDAVENNMKEMRGHMRPGVQIMGVIKADGYGHGAVPVAKTIDPYVTSYGSATIEEAVLLRKHGITKPVLVLGTVHESQFGTLLDYEITPSIYQYDKALALSNLALKQGKKAGIQIAVDTGMSRIGIVPGEGAVSFIKQIHSLPGIVIEGMFTHFAKADEHDKETTREQLKRYMDFDSALRQHGIEIPLCHCSNSAAIMEMPDSHLDLVRAGIAIYGLYPSDEVDHETIRLKPAMELKSCVRYVKDIKAGVQVSYGGLFKAEKNMKIATIPVGYGDGYPRSLSGIGSVLIKGERAPILGRVCMDQMMVDVSHIPDIQEDDEVTLLGRDGSQTITMEELAQLSGIFHYELPCILGKRVPRVYLRNGKAVGKKDYFNDIYEDFMA